MSHESHTTEPVEGLHALMERYIDGDDQAFAKLYERVSPRVRAKLGRLTSDAAQVEDLVQLTFMRAHAARGRFASVADHPDRAVEAWYTAIARNVTLDDLRHRYRRDRRHATLVARGEVEGMGVPEGGLDPEAQSLERERAASEAKRVREAIEQLPPGQRDVVQLHKLRGLSMAEIAERLQVRPGALRVRAHRAYKGLYHLLVGPEAAPTA